MRFSEPVRMADDGEHSPVWARTKRRSGGNPLVGIIVTLLALFGVLTAVLGIKEQSLAEGGAMMDGWITKGVSTVRGEAPGSLTRPPTPPEPPLKKPAMSLRRELRPLPTR